MAVIPDNICCPHCGERLGLTVTSKLMDSSRMSFAIHPNKGELLSARNVGGAIEQMDKLLVAVGRDLGAKTAVLIEGMSFSEGSVKVDLLVTRHESKIKKSSPTHEESRG